MRDRADKVCRTRRANDDLFHHQAGPVGDCYDLGQKSDRASAFIATGKVQGGQRPEQDQDGSGKQECKSCKYLSWFGLLHIALMTRALAPLLR